MTLFDSGNQTTTNDEGSNQESFVEKLASTKGEDWRNPEVIAKGKLEADNHIKELERQLAELMEDLSKQDYAKTLLEKLQPQAADPGNASGAGQDNNTGTAEENTTLDAEELKSLIEQTLTQREKENTSQKNLQETASRLNELFGTEAEAEVKKRAEAIGMNIDKLQEIAAESPTAFFKLISSEPLKQETNTTPNNAVNTDAGFNNSAERDWQFYQKLRRENPKLYYSPSTQQQLLNDKLRLGDKFGN